MRGNLTSGTRFIYNFVADFNGTLTVNFETLMDFTPDPLGAGGYTISVSGFSLQATGPGVSGTGLATFDLLAGTGYSYQISSNTNLGGNLGERRMESMGVFDWNFAPDVVSPVPVPEPGALALMVVGFCLLPYLQQRNRAARS